MSDMICQRVIFISGAGHSGTTLLGMMLGSHPDALFAGEMQESRFIGDQTRPLHKRTCRACGTQCPIWNTKTLTEGYIYESLAQRSGRPVIIDSTKKPLSWVKTHAQTLSVPRSLILLMRDPRAVVASNLRKFPQKTAREHTEDWVLQIRECESLMQDFPGFAVRVHYEKLATSPKSVLQTLCEEIRFPYTDEMLYPWDKDHHPLRGNMGTQSIAYGTTSALLPIRQAYYANHPKEVVLDERWKQELDTETVHVIREVAGDYFDLYAWNNEN